MRNINVELMPNVSKRSQEVPLSPFRKLAALAEQVKQEGRKVYHLNIGQPDILTPPGAMARLKEMPFRIVPYTPAEDCAEPPQRS